MVQHKAKKRFGQNFLIDGNVIKQIVNLINPKPNQFILEIGPGLAALTNLLLTYTCQLQVIEIDRDIIKYLKQKFGNKLVIHAQDALKFDYSFNNQAIRVVGNLPYNISTPLLFHLAQFSNIQDMHFMLQKEVVDRICAIPNTKDYGRLSIMLQYKFNCSKLLEVNKEAFSPQPKVKSAIVKLVPKNPLTWQLVNHNKLNQIVTLAFNQRRKTIANSLKPLIEVATLNNLGINPQKRAENLTIAEYLQLAQLN